MTDEIIQRIKLSNRLGLHARASAKLVALAKRFESNVQIGTENKLVDATSIMSVMMLAAAEGTELTVVARGSDRVEAIAAVIELIDQRFGEPD